MFAPVPWSSRTARLLNPARAPAPPRDGWRGGLVWFAAALAALAPSVNAAELDVPYVQTPQPVVDRMLELAGVKATDFVMDVGCGDGRMVVTAAKTYGARGLGIDIDPQRIAEAKLNAQRAGVANKVEFRVGNLFAADISQADVLAMYLLETVNMQLRPKILSTMKPGVRVVSHAFTMGDWKADLQESIDGKQVFMWVVPARVDGRWLVRQGEGNAGFEMTLQQAFQEFTGVATIDGRQVPIRDGHIRGSEISFAIDAEENKTQNFRGRVKDEAIEVVAGGGPQWLARRQP
jgi:2-polyprenyl-3-methyl-5-hydroxy-6-metoxy-1,4-benzoquinol methylase